MTDYIFQPIRDILNSKIPSDDLPDIPDDVGSFLGNLGMLSGVPLYYLIPHEAYLPVKTVVKGDYEIETGAFKFFKLDKEWLYSLTDGALSVGGSLEDRHLILEKATAGNFVADEFIKAKKALIARQVQGAYGPDELKDEFSKRLNRFLVNGKPEPTAAQNNWSYSGFFIRSSIISQWPGVEITAMGKDDDKKPATRQLQVIRQERVANDIFFCLCEGLITIVTIKQPAESFHFGVTHTESTNKFQAGATGAEVPFRNNPPDGVIDIDALAGAGKLSIEKNDSANFARVMMAKPAQFIITINT